VAAQRRPTTRHPGALNWGRRLFGVLVAALGLAHAEPLPVAIDKALRLQQINQVDLSLYLREVTQTQPRIAVNADTPRQPASTIKLLTSIAALGRLGPNFRWQTRAWLDGPLVNGRLAGNLIIQGGGDPSLRLADLWRFLRALRAQGLQTIGGDLIIDNSAFDPPETTRAAFDGKGQSGYNALPVAFSIDEQLTQVELRLDPKSAALSAWLEPPVANLDIQNQLKVVKAPCQTKHHRVHAALTGEHAPTIMTLTGTFASECQRDSVAGLLLDPVQQAGRAVLALWQDLGGRLEGTLREGVRPKGATLLHAIESPELPVVLRDVNKWSNNLIARTLFLTIGMERYGRPATLEKGRDAIKEWLDQQGLDFPELVLDNGSGLSRSDRISAQSMGRLLAWAYTHPGMAELMASLPILGVDGTLHRRFKREPLRAQGHLKTGTTRGVTALAGFLDDARGRRWVLVSLINNPRLATWRGKAVEDAILRWVYDETGGERRGAGGSGPAGKAAKLSERGD
jgi:D-alanyl-D-alanine carboxypeptidase/D-alanyl-D-alanine-endopeptidase (penicillin-binding protein 4)